MADAKRQRFAAQAFIALFTDALKVGDYTSFSQWTITQADRADLAPRPDNQGVAAQFAPAGAFVVSETKKVTYPTLLGVLSE